MEDLHLIRDETMRELVRRVTQNDATLTALTQLPRMDPGYGGVDVWLALGHALRDNTHLQELWLTNPVLTEEAAHALAQGIAQCRVTTITHSGDCREHPTSHESGQNNIRDILYRGIQSSRTIQAIHLYHSLIDDPGDAWRDALLRVASITIEVSKSHVQAFSNVLSRTTLLRKLSILSFTKNMEADDISMLAHGLCQNTSITNLVLKCYGFNSQDWQLLLAQGPSPNSSLNLLAMNGSADDDCIDLLVERWLTKCPTITHLTLIVNIGPAGAQHLMQALTTLPTMSTLNLQCNMGIGYEGLRIIGNELPNLQHLTSLCLAYCSIWNKDMKAESEAAQAQTRARQLAGQALLDGIKRNLSITKLEVSGNSLPPHVEHEIYFYSALNGVGRYLLAAAANEDDHGLADSVWCHILVKCQRRPMFGPSLVYFYLKEQPSLVQQACRRRRRRGSP